MNLIYSMNPGYWKDAEFRRISTSECIVMGFRPEFLQLSKLSSALFFSFARCTSGIPVVLGFISFIQYVHIVGSS